MQSNFKSVELIKSLSEARGISGFEDEVISLAQLHAERFAVTSRDSLLNCYIRRKTPDSSKPVVMLDGHTDEIGFMVQSVTPSGMLRIVPVGGWIAHNVPAHEFDVRTKNGGYIRGISTSKPPHFMSEEERSKAIKIEEILIDVCATSAEDAETRLGVSVGAPVVPIARFTCDESTSLMVGKAFDNRLGCACVLEIMEQLSSDSLNVEPVGALSSQEEIGLRGATVAVESIKPDIAIVFEGTPADDSWEGASNIQGGIGKGPQIRYWDRSMVANPRFVDFAIEAADAAGITIQRAVRTGGGTDGGAIHLANCGIPTIVIGVPVRYAHSHYGVASHDDFRSAVAWGAAVVRALDANAVSLM